MTWCQYMPVCELQWSKAALSAIVCSRSCLKPGITISILIQSLICPKQFMSSLALSCSRSSKWSVYYIIIIQSCTCIFCLWRTGEFYGLVPTFLSVTYQPQISMRGYSVYKICCVISSPGLLVSAYTTYAPTFALSSEIIEFKIAVLTCKYIDI